MYRNGIQNYRRARVETADPKRLVILCYEEMIFQLRAARQECEEKNYVGKSKRLLKVQEILCELQGALDFEQGGAIARNLDALYHYARRRLLQADIQKDLEAMDEVGGILSELKSSWEQAFHSLDKKTITPVAVSLASGRDALGAMAI